MHGRRLSTTDIVVVVTDGRSGETVEKVKEWCEKEGLEHRTVEVGEEVGEIPDEKQVLGVTAGGNGTFLEAVDALSPRGIPVLGIRTSDVAFLARVSVDDIEDALDEVIRGRATVETRQQYRIEADGIEGIDDVTTGINEVVVQRLTPDDPVGRKITRLEVMADDEYVGEFVGTGLSVSTPTGSTGLSLSAGGPVHYPKNNSTLQLVPLHTHNVGVRPLVVSGSTEITIGVEDPASVLVDGGRAHASLEPGDVLTVTSAEKPANFVSTSYNRPFFRSLSESLGWGIRTSDDSPDTLESGGSGSVQEGDDGSGDTVSRAIRVATEAAKGAGEPLRELGGKVESIQFKTDKSDIVTEADYQSEHIITTVVENEFPDHSVRSEEDVQLEGDSEYTWLVDPLDGTGNFAHGNPNYAVSIGLLKSNTPVAGVVYAPETDDLFYARRGGMAYQNGQPITTTDRDRLDESMLLSGYDPDGSFISHYYQRTRGVRSLGSAALHLCYLASGSADAVWEYDTYPWDVAAGTVIAEAAGADLTDSDGNDYELDLTFDDEERERNELLGSNGPLHDELLKHLRSDEGLSG